MSTDGDVRFSYAEKILLMRLLGEVPEARIEKLSSSDMIRFKNLVEKIRVHLCHE